MNFHLCLRPKINDTPKVLFWVGYMSSRHRRRPVKAELKTYKSILKQRALCNNHDRAVVHFNRYYHNHYKGKCDDSCPALMHAPSVKSAMQCCRNELFSGKSILSQNKVEFSHFNCLLSLNIVELFHFYFFIKNKLIVKVDYELRNYTEVTI